MITRQHDLMGLLPYMRSVVECHYVAHVCIFLSLFSYLYFKDAYEFWESLSGMKKSETNCAKSWREFFTSSRLNGLICQIRKLRLLCTLNSLELILSLSISLLQLFDESPGNLEADFWVPKSETLLQFPCGSFQGAAVL